MSPSPRSPGAATYAPAYHVCRLAANIFDCHPCLLKPGTRGELQSLLGDGPLLLEAAVRAGCLQLTLNVLLSGSEEAALFSAEGLRAWVDAVVRKELFGVQPHMVVQARNLLGLVVAGMIPYPPGFMRPPLPRLAAVLPLCTLPGEGQYALQGADLSNPGAQVHCRQRDRNPGLDLLDRGGQGPCSCREAARAGAQLCPRGDNGGRCCCPVALVRDLEIGYAEVEVQLGKLMSAPRAILVLPDPQAVREVRTLEVSSAGIPDVDAFLRNVGVLAHYLYRDRIAGAERFEPMYCPKLLRRLETMAQECAAVAVSRNWHALSRLLLPASTAGGTAGSVALAAMDALCPSPGGLMYIAASSDCADTLDAMVAWAVEEGVDIYGDGDDADEEDADDSPSTSTGASEPALVEPGEAEAEIPFGKAFGATLPPVKPAAGGCLELTREDFGTAFHRAQLWKELWHEGINTAAALTVVWRAWSSDAGIGTLRIALGTLSIVAPAAVMMRLAHRASPGYLRRRTLYVLLLRTLRSATSFLGYRDVYSLAGIHSLALPPGLGMAAVHLLRWPLVILIATLCHPLPLAGNLLATLCVLGLYLPYLSGRCTLECGLPGQGSRYQGVLAAVEGAHGASWLGGDAAAAADGLAGCRYSCLSVNGWLMLLVGAAIPVWAVALGERRAWRRWQGQAVMQSHGSALQHLAHACGLALASAACLLLAEFGARALA